MSDKKCCVRGCASTQGLAILHGFPNPEKDKERFNVWLMAIGGDILGLHNNHIHKYRKVCHIHFAAKYHCRNNKISNVAVPTLNIPGPLSLPQFSFSERRPMRDIQNIEPSSSKEVVPQPQSIFGECPSLKKLDIKTSFISEGPEMPSDSQIIVGEKEVVPSSSDLQQIQKSCSKKHGPEMPSDCQIIVEEMEVVPSSSELRQIQKSCSKKHGTEMPSDSRIIVEEMEVVPSSSVLQKIQKSCSKKHEPTPQGEDMQLSDTIPPGNNKEAVLRTDKGILQAESKDTADLLLFMDSLFDSVNGSATKNIHAKPLLGPVTPNSLHAKLWRESKPVLASMQFITATGKKKSVPTIHNWIWTIDGMQLLLQNLRNKFGVTSVWLRHLNQDPIENFFGAIRSHGGRNVNPTCDQFESAYVALLINNLSTVHSHGKNCEEDFTRALHALVIDNNSESKPPCTIEIGDIIDINLTPLPEKEAIASVIAPLQYVSGYILKKTKASIFKNCPVCKGDFINTDTDAEDVEYIKYREYSTRLDERIIWVFFYDRN